MVTIPVQWRDLAKWQRAAKDAEMRASLCAAMQDAPGAAAWLLMASRANLRVSEGLEKAADDLAAQGSPSVELRKPRKVKPTKVNGGCPPTDHDVSLCGTIQPETTMETVLGADTCEDL